MDSLTIFLCACIAIILAIFLGYLFWQQRKSENTEASNSQQNIQLQLQAYERLALLTDRIALNNVIARVNQPGLAAKDMQLLIVQNIRQEFEYNITQQIYVSADAWSSVKNLKEQSLLVVNQLANALPHNATGLDLSKLILEYLMNDPKGSLHEVVSEVLSYEAKKLL
jgi:type II secretory pathway pseudopilin PulG